MRKILIIIPTLNEKGNISIILKKIKKFQKQASVLFVDDNSKDGSINEIKNYKKKNKNIFLLLRNNKRGVGSAHKDGLKWGYKKGFNYLCTLDCDGTHDPKDIKKMLKKIDRCDLVNTNRFLNKKALTNWKLDRIILTKLRYFLVKTFLKTNLDSSGGFRLYDRRKIKLDDILSAKDNHYNFFWESLFLLERKYSIKEIPIVLPKRSLGKSKMKIKDVLYGFFYLIKIFLKN
jgi:dolichol-phosphate mannosyltransferase